MLTLLADRWELSAGRSPSRRHLQARRPVSPAGPIVLIDGTVDRTAVVYEGQGPEILNVDWGDTVQFLVRPAGAPERTMKWRFNGLDNVVSYADIDPRAEFARNVRIYVNQTYNPSHNSAD
jgi:hypothetical protein